MGTRAPGRCGWSFQAKSVVLILAPLLLRETVFDSLVPALLVVVVLAVGSPLLAILTAVLSVLAAGASRAELIDLSAQTVLWIGEALVVAVLMAWGRLIDKEAWRERGRKSVLWTRGVLLGATVFFFGLSFFETASLAEVLALFWIAFAFWWVLWTSFREEHLPLRLLALNVALVLVSLVLSVGLLELGARAFVPVATIRGEIFGRHPDCIFLLHPGGRGMWPIPLDADGTQKEVAIEISEQGLRDRVYGPKAPDEYRILLLGDSYTMGHSVDEEETVPRQLEGLLQGALPGKRITVINGGCSAAGPAQEQVMLVERGLRLEPDLVILQVYTGNDFAGMLETVGKFPRSYNVIWRKELGRFRMKHLLSYRLDGWARQHSGLYGFVTSRTAFDKPLISLIESLRCNSENRAPELPASEPRPFLIECDLAEWYSELEEGLALFKECVRDMRAVCEEKGVGFAAYCFPDMYHVDHDEWRRQAASAPGTSYRWRKADRLVEEFLMEEEIPLFSVSQALREGPPMDELFYRYDGHPTAQGNALVAREIRRWLTIVYFPGHRAVLEAS